MNAEKYRPFLFAFFGLALAISISGAEIALALLLLDAAVHRRWTPGSARRSPIERPLLIFLAWGVVVTLVAGSAKFSKALSSQGGLLFFFLAVRSWSVEENDRWIRWFLYGAAATAVFAALQVGLGVDRYPVQDQLIVPEWLQVLPEKVLREIALRNERAVGTRSHPLTFAEGLLVALVLLATLPLGRTDRWRRFRWIGLPIIGVGLLFSQGRGVWLGAAGAAAVIGWYGRGRREVRWAMVAAAISVAVVVAVVPTMRARALSIVAPGGGQASDRTSRNLRFELWSAAWDTIQSHPVMGVGIKGVKLMVEDPTIKAVRPWSEAHNIALQVGAERGLVGLGLFIWIFVLAFGAASRAPPGWRDGAVALLIGLLIAGITESWIKDKEIAMIFWAVLGALERRRMAASEAA